MEFNAISKGFNAISKEFNAISKESVASHITTCHPGHGQPRSYPQALRVATYGQQVAPRRVGIFSRGSVGLFYNPIQQGVIMFVDMCCTVVRKRYTVK